MASTDAEIVGREGDVAAISTFLDRASLPAALLLQGEAGIGKTTLWRYAVGEAERRGLRVAATTAVSAEA